MEEYLLRKECAVCGSANIESVLDYGNVPLAGHFPKEEELAKAKKYPLQLLFCNDCSLLQTDCIVNPDVLFKDYRYMSSIGLQSYFDKVAKYLVSQFHLTEQSVVFELGSNDGVLQAPLLKEHVRAIGFEPSTNISQYAIQKGCTVINDFFNEETAKKHIEEHSADLIFGANCFAHIDDIHSVVKGLTYALKKDGFFVLEVHYAKNLIENLQYDNVYHEHMYYYSLNSLKNLFKQYGMTIVDYEELPIHAGSIRVTVLNTSQEEPKKVQERLLEEENFGLTKREFYAVYASRVVEHKNSLIALLEKFKKEGKKVVGYGASGRANTLCNYCGIDSKLVSYIVDESPERNGRYIPGEDIPIYDKDVLDEDKEATIILIFAWNFSKMIMEKIEGKGYSYVIPFPMPKVVHSVEELDSETL